MKVNGLDVAHEFALFVGDELYLKTVAPGTSIALNGKALCNRLVAILRIQIDERLIFFDTEFYASVQIVDIKKNSVIVRLITINRSVPMTPNIHWLLPILEKSAFEEAITFLTVLGATSIQPVLTQKTHRSAYSDKGFERIKKLMIAAAEQSKQFVFPELKPLISLNDLSSNLANLTTAHAPCARLFFDSTGELASVMMKRLHEFFDEAGLGCAVICMVGPEGDLAFAEKDLLKTLSFDFYKLTPSILRSSHAILVSMGMLRSLLRG